MIVVRIRPEDTHVLRRRVLRDGDPGADVEWAVDDLPTTTHLAVTDTDPDGGGGEGRDDRSTAGSVIAVSTWIVTDEGLQLRGMATDPGHRGSGAGSLLVAAGIALARRDGHPRVWANARVTALGFYEHHGFAVEGDVFTTPDTGLPHRRVHLVVT